MSRRYNMVAAVAVAAVLAVFMAGVWRVFVLRFASGEVHPPYSTLNAAPTGARAVYDSLARLGRPEVARNVLPLSRFKGRAGTTLVLAGAGVEALGEDSIENFERVEAMMRDGLRVVVALDARVVPDVAPGKDPVADPWRSEDRWAPGGKPGRGGRRATGEGEEEEEERMVSAGNRWGFRFETEVDPEHAPKEGFAVVPEVGGPPEVPRWFSVWRWAGLGPDWKSLATVAGRPVIIRREFGQGSLTLLSDTVFLSNEALYRAPAPAFLLWLLATEPHLVFDETLHGSVSDPGVMHLVRRYRLLGFFAAAAALLGLFAWRAGSSLVPVHASVAEASGRPLAGAEGAAGFSNLLRQTIPRRTLLRTCFTEWAKSPFVRRRVAAGTVAAVRDTVEAAEKDGRATVAATCRTIAFLVASARKDGSA